MNSPKRRNLLRTLALGGATGLAGCQSGERTDVPPTAAAVETDAKMETGTETTTTTEPDVPTTWPSFKYGAENSGVYESGLKTTVNATEKWTYRIEFDAESPVKTFSSPIVGTELVYVGASDGTLYALDRDAGTLIWSFDAEGTVDSTPVFSNGTVYVGSAAPTEGGVFALDAATGDVRWSADEVGPVENHLTVAYETVFVGDDETLYAFDAETGDVRWKKDQRVRGAPAVTALTVYVVTEDSELLALEREGGAVEWSRSPGDSETDLLGTPAVEGGTVFVADDAAIYAYRGNDGKSLWRYDAADADAVYAYEANDTKAHRQWGAAEKRDASDAGSLVGVAAMGPRNVYATTRAGSVHRIAAFWDGTIEADVFEVSDHTFEASPVMADRVLYVGGTDRTVYALTADDMQKWWEYETPGEIGNAAAKVEKTLFVVGDDGTVHALEMEPFL